MAGNKPKVIKDFDKLSDEMQEQIVELYPNGYHEHLVKFTDKDGKYVHAVPFETEDRYYLVRMPNLVSPPKSKVVESDDAPKDDDHESEQDGDSDKYADLDTMQVSSGRKSRDDDDDYD
ncbi:MAG: hypothetical protein ACRCVT_07115 [Leadbetterella sp.]